MTGEPREGGEGEGRRSEVASGAEGQASRPEGSDVEGGGLPGRAGAGGGRPSEEDLPFRDEYSAAGGEAPVAVVLFRDDYAPPTGVYYLRQSAFSQYNGVRLVQSTGPGLDRDVVELFPGRRLEVAAAPPEGAFRREVATTVGLIAEHQHPFALDSPSALWPIRNPDPLRFRRAYDVLSRVPVGSYRDRLGHRAGLAGWGAAEMAHYTAAPGDPRYGRLAKEILARLPEPHRDDPLARAFAVKMWLEENGTYSRRSRHSGAEDPTASFLFGDLTGYCVHFAHASVFLLRALGVPARVGAGYAVEEARRGSGSALLVRGLDAHAWPEVAIDGAGWVVVDVSPARSLEQQPDSPDAALQQMLGESLRNGPREPPEGSASRLPGLAELGRGALVLALAAIAGAFVVKLYRAVAPGLASPRSVHRVAYRSALDRLADVGLRRQPGETREAFAARVRGASPAFGPLTRQHLAWAHGSRRALDPEQSRRLARQVAAEARRAVPPWRFVVGTLNPVSYLASR